MLTPREQATGEYNVAMAQGRRRILGVDDEDMVTITADRVWNVRRAQRAIQAAEGTDRIFLREPDDHRLAQMLEAVSALVDTLEDDGTRWASR